MKSLFKRKSLAVVSAFFVASIVTSCHDEEVANIEELSYRHGYEYNFVKTFGEIDPNQSWDFSSYARAKRNYFMTRAATVNDFGMPLYEDQGHLWYNIPTELHQYILDYVMEENGMSGNDKKDRIDDALWHAFSFEATNTDAFDLLCFYLGASQSSYHFNMVVVDPDYPEEVVSDTKLWDLQHTQMQWHSQGGDNSGWKKIEGSNGSGGHGSTSQAATTRAEPILIDFSDPKYGLTEDNKKYTVYFYIYIDIAHTQINHKDDVLTSITHQPNIVAIDVPPSIDAITNNAGYNAMLFGCETGCPEKSHLLTDGRCDYDYDDLMFLLVGRIPTIRYDDCLQKQIIKKRYLIEDLVGFDFDFNDIVVDATDLSIRYFKINEENGIVTEPEEGIDYNGVHYPLYEQEASIRWLCGTLPFKVIIGDKTFNQVTDPTNKTQTQDQLNGTPTTSTTTILGSKTGIDPEFTTSITGWDPDNNNISAIIWTERNLTTGSTDSSEGLDGPWVWQSTFPSVGDVPYIIAVDPLDIYIQPELEHIPTSWLGGDMSTDTYTVNIEVIPIENTSTTTNP